ncbi:MAG TPA: ABC transporter ATP-binding protein [Alphaproteobacteria bacterium]|jgi:ABC-type polysaccharide/polyol phosphate transport system ATPase subunit|nr:ABC transporter ATP-binding protein [Alphaproteobacteria bacterium]
MASIVVKNVVLDYPIYGASHRSFRTALLGRTGGLIRQESGRQHRVVVRALDDVSFTLDHGDRLGLVGHNGAGKSTLLRLLAGVYAPVSGEVITEGRISPLFTAAPGIDIEDTGYENIRTCGMFLGMSREEIAAKTPEIAEFCELGDYLNLPVRTYSAGMMTRLAFAIATSIDPGILLLDEGLGAGDARFAARAEKRMMELINRSSIMVLASHSDAMIKDVCSKAALMESGRLIAIGSVDEIMARYHASNQ